MCLPRTARLSKRADPVAWVRVERPCRGPANLDHLRRYYNRFSGEVEMSDGHILPVAQRKKSQLLDLLNSINLPSAIE